MPMERKYISSFNRVRKGKKEEVKSHWRTISKKSISSKEKEKVRLGKSVELLSEENIYIKLLNEGDVRIPKWFLNYKFQHEAYEFWKENKKLPKNKERIMIALKENDYYSSIKDLAKDSNIDHRNIGRYINELEDNQKIVRLQNIDNTITIMDKAHYDSSWLKDRYEKRLIKKKKN